MLPWAAFLERYRPLARAIAERLARRPEDAEDIVQEATVALFAAWRLSPERFESTRHARNYFLRAVRNQAARAHERERPTASLAEDPPDTSASSAEAQALRARRNELGRLLRQLPAQERELMARRFLRRETLAHISAATGVPVSTLHNRERKVLRELRAALERLGGASDG